MFGLNVVLNQILKKFIMQIKKLNIIGAVHKLRNAFLFYYIMPLPSCTFANITPTCVT